jgi:group I intron endonuclease
MIATENLKWVCGVYCAIHRDSGRCYVGSAVDMHKRRMHHIWRAKSGRDGFFTKSLRRLGQEAFDFEIIERCPKERLLEKEKFYIAFYNAASLNGFNTLTDPTAGNRGTVYSAVTRARMGAWQKGRRPSDACIAAVRMAHMGRKKTPEELIKLRLANLGRKMPVSAIEKTAASRRRPVEQLCLESGSVLRRYDSGSSASIAMGKNVKHDGIGRICRGNGKMSCGFGWRFSDE